MDITSLIIEAVSGAVGGNVAGAAMKEKSLGAIGNSIAGIVGGGLGGTILQTVMGTAAAGVFHLCSLSLRLLKSAHFSNGKIRFQSTVQTFVPNICL
jgi:uncharacterized membrane protein YeaQ/YmgE (transglycosylase-associated protein family)